MTFEGFKNYCEAKKSGKIILPRNDEEYKIAIHEAIIDIATTNNIIPLNLVTHDKNDEVLRPLDDEVFVRVPRVPQNQNDVIDIDFALHLAVLYSFLEKVTVEQESIFYRNKKDDEISKYNWNNFMAFQATDNK